MWLSEQPEILTLYKKYDYDEMKNILLTWLNPETEETTEETVEEAPVVQTAYSTPAAKKKSSFDEDEFDALFVAAKPSNSIDEDDDMPF